MRVESIDQTSSCTIASREGMIQAVIVPELGGIVSSLSLPGPRGAREVLFRHDWFWDDTDALRGGIPLLFPICGRLDNHRLPIHGFAARMPWTVMQADTPDRLDLELTDTEATRALYPYPFRLVLSYRVTDEAFVCNFTVTNRGNTDLPYYAGFHPYFLTPPPGQGKGAVTLHARATKRAVYNERLTDIVGEAEPPPFPLSIADASINELLLHVGADGETRLAYPDRWQLVMNAYSDADADAFPYRQLYTIPDKPFVCVEPWMSHPGALHRTGATRVLPPGASETVTLVIQAVSP